MIRRYVFLALLAATLCSINACSIRRPGTYREPVVPYEEPSWEAKLEADFVINAANILDHNYYAPSSLDYQELYNAALVGVRNELRLHGVKWSFRAIEHCNTQYSAGDRFIVEFDRALRAGKEAKKLGRHALVFAATDHMMASLGRSHTVFIYPGMLSDDDEKKEFRFGSGKSGAYATGKKIFDDEHEWSYVKFSGFEDESYSDFVDLYHDPGIFFMSVQGVVMDLRGNPGGSDLVLKEMLSVFLEKGTIAFYAKSEKGGTDVFSTMHGPITKLPLVVLIDEHSGSASEIFAAVIQESGRGTIVGKKSSGAVEVGAIFKLDYNAQVMITLAQVYTAEGKCLEKVGVTPDYEAKQSFANQLNDEDPCLEKALEILKEKCEDK